MGPNAETESIAPFIFVASDNCDSTMAEEIVPQHEPAGIGGCVPAFDSVLRHPSATGQKPASRNETPRAPHWR
jgi:hypothetical protein